MTSGFPKLVFINGEQMPAIANDAPTAFYEEIGHAFNPEPKDPRPFLALQQSNGSSSSSRSDASNEVETRAYEMIQNYNPNKIEEKPSAQILAVEMNPSDPEDFEKWYREEHLNLLSKLPGYYRSTRYQISQDSSDTTSTAPKYLAIHYVDDIAVFGGPEAEVANTTPWTLKQIEQSNPFIARGWKLVNQVGL